jgi:AcrR family transcriptional regulator
MSDISDGPKSPFPAIHPARIADGRRQRSKDSQQRIVVAMLDLVAKGNLAPSAEQIAESANVGLRSVFRHFKDMESLHQELFGSAAAAMLALIKDPFKARDWRGQVLELVDRRAGVFEKMRNFLLAGQIHRHRSAVLKAGHARFVSMLTQILTDLLPAESARHAEIVHAIDLLLSFEAWHRLREDQHLDVEPAKHVLKQAVTALLAKFPEA